MIWELKVHLILLGGIILAIGLMKLLPIKTQRHSVHVLHKIDPYEYRSKENLIINCDGDVILRQPDFSYAQ